MSTVLKLSFARMFLVFSLIFLFLTVLASFGTAPTFFYSVTGNTVNYNTVDENELKEEQPIDGSVYYIYDCIAEGYTEHSQNGTVLSTTTDSYYYLIPFEDDVVMLLKTDASSDLEDQIDDLLYASYGYDDPDNLLENGVAIEGIVRKNEDEIVEVFEEWCDEYNFTDLSLVPYTLDCSLTAEDRCNQFYVAVVFFIIAIALFIPFILLRKSVRRDMASQNNGNLGAIPNPSMNYNMQAGVPNNANLGDIPDPNTPNYNPQGFNANNTYNPNVYNQVNSYQPQQQPYQTQNNFGADSANGYNNRNGQ